jgi:hypothetical protein
MLSQGRDEYVAFPSLGIHCTRIYALSAEDHAEDRAAVGAAPKICYEFFAPMAAEQQAGKQGPAKAITEAHIEGFCKEDRTSARAEVEQLHQAMRVSELSFKPRRCRLSIPAARITVEQRQLALNPLLRGLSQEEEEDEDEDEEDGEEDLLLIAFKEAMSNAVLRVTQSVSIKLVSTGARDAMHEKRHALVSSTPLPHVSCDGVFGLRVFVELVAGARLLLFGGVVGGVGSTAGSSVDGSRPPGHGALAAVRPIDPAYSDEGNSDGGEGDEDGECNEQNPRTMNEAAPTERPGLPRRLSFSTS